MSSWESEVYDRKADTYIYYSRKNRKCIQCLMYFSSYHWYIIRNCNNRFRWMPCPWKCSRPGWTGLWATWSSERCPAHSRRVGTGRSIRSLPTQTILWFCVLESSLILSSWKSEKYTYWTCGTPFIFFYESHVGMVILWSFWVQNIWTNTWLPSVSPAATVFIFLNVIL